MSTIAQPPPPPDATEAEPRRGDSRDGQNYVLPPEVALRVDVAWATGRPLLVRGQPGTGKSSLAAHIARTRGWRFHDLVTTSRTEARDLLWRYDTLGRLNDASDPQALVGEPASYVEPQALWWALSPSTAATYGGREGNPRENPGTHAWPLGDDPGDVVLIDEIDKADPEVPNDLLVTVGSLQFRVLETGDTIAVERPPFLVFTTNAERDLPPAFLRRCITVELATPTGAALKAIGERHFPGLDGALHTAVEGRISHLREKAEELGLRSPSIAEYLDTLAACRELAIGPDSPAWKALTAATLWKDGDAPDGTDA
ncbi:MAG: MoxR family ATPase [Alphaproteobacteria bacterium]|nr:MoxR family ATPase [Alphaproteobacteria bacterium]